MPRIGYHASHEQYAPSALLKYAEAAQRAGFRDAMCSDHFFPWSERQKHSGFAWSWLGAALARTDLSFGVVNAPGQRYNPAIIAQAAATLAEMFPERFWLATGSGQFLNEHITGAPWPRKEERNARLLEAVQVMRALWRGETVTHRGHFVVEDACLYTRPERPPLVVGAAITAKTARWVGGWADALITVSQPVETMREVLEAFREGGGEGKPTFLQIQISYAPTDEEARKAAFDQWRTNIFASRVLSDLRMPADFDAAAKFVQPGDLDDGIHISSDLARHRDWLHECADVGFERLYVHCVHPDQERFIESFGEHVLPHFDR